MPHDGSISLELATPVDMGQELASRGKWFFIVFLADNGHAMTACPCDAESLSQMRQFCGEFIEAYDDQLAELERRAEEEGEPPRHQDHHGN